MTVPLADAAAPAPRAVRRFYLYRILSRSYFHLPILLVWLLETRGESTMTAGWVLACYPASLVVGGSAVRSWIGPKLGARRLVVAGEVLKLAGLALLIAPGGTVLALVGGQLIGGFGYVMAQGPDSVLLRAMLAGRPDSEYAVHESRSMSAVFATMLVAGIAGAVAYGYHPVLPFLLAMTTTLGAAVTAMTFGVSGQLPARAARRGRARPSRDALRWIAYYTSMRAVALAAAVGLMPLFLFFQLRLSLLVFAAVISAFNLSAALSGRYGRAVAGARSHLAAQLSPVGMSLGFVCLALARSWILVIPGVVVVGLLAGMVRPVTMSELNRTGGAAARDPGLLSLAEQIYGVLNASLLVAIGYAAHVATPRALVWCAAAAALLAGAAALLGGRRPARAADDRAAAGAQPQPRTGGASRSSLPG